MENPTECLGSAFEFVNATGLSATIAREANSFFCLENNWSSVQEAIEKLKAVNKSVTIKVIDEINKLHECDHEVDLWLKKTIQGIQNDTLEEEYNKLERCGLACSCTPNLPQRYLLGKQIVEKLECVKNLIQEGKQFTTFGHQPLPDRVEARPLTQPVGIKPMLRLLHEYFNDKKRSVIGVWGQGGVGKTTLLNAFNNSLKDLPSKNTATDQSNVFHVVIAIDVSNSETLDMADIQKTITERLGLPWVDSDTETTRAKNLMKALSRKRFVILLDDVWKQFCLEDVGIPIPNIDNGCKIVLASRDQNVCIQMNAHENGLIGMELLDETASWKLFKSNLGKDARDLVFNDVSIETCAKAISRKCGGLPLALNVIGKTVASFKSLIDWEDAEKAISANMGELEGVKDVMFPRLRYSYDKLDTLVKQCFLYCTLFPEYSSIRRDELAEYWMAEGFIPQNEPWKASIIINKLLSVCLLQSTSSELKVRLHNVLRNFGLWLAHKENNFLVQSGQGSENPPEIEDWQGPKRISLVSNNIRDISFSPKCSNLETLLLQKNKKLSSLCPKFFTFMSNLKVLDLSNTAIRELPECDTLVQLEYLNLSQTQIKKLPERLWVLQQLRHLDLSVTKDLKNTFNNCSKLLKLRVLNLFRSHYGIRDVFDLNIDTLKQLSYLGISIHAEDVLKKLKKTDPLAKSTHWLSLKYCKGMQSIHVADFNQMENLEELYIEFCKNLNEMVVDQDEIRISHLKVLTLWKLSSLETILVKPFPHHFTKLRDLTIDECPKLNHVSWIINLKSLEKLAISRCSGMIQIVIETPNGKQGSDPESSKESEIRNEGSNIELPKLRSIVLSELEELVSICSARDFLCLESIRVQDCPKLKKLPIAHDYHITKLQQICGSLEWWQDLHWDDEVVGESLEDFFIPYGSNGGH